MVRVARVGHHCAWALGAGLTLAAGCAPQPPAEPVAPSSSHSGPTAVAIAEAPPESRPLPGGDAALAPLGPPAGPRDLRRLPSIQSLAQGEQELKQLRLLIQAGSSDREHAMMTWRAALLAQALATHPDNDQHGVDKMTRNAKAWLHEVATKPRYAKYIQADEALYMLGALTMREDPTYAQTSMRELIMRYPASEWIGPAYLSFAEALYAKRKAEGAGKLFEKAFQMSKADRAYALAMQGRCWLIADGKRSAQPGKALAALVRAWGLSRDQEAVRDAADAARVRNLVELDLAAAYAAAGRPGKAVDFFQAQLDHATAMRVLEALVTVYGEKHDDASVAKVCAGAPELPACARP